MNILDKAKKVAGSVADFDSDEAIANTIIKAVKKQERVNKLLAEKGSNYRVADIELGMSIPPSVTFGVRRVEGEASEEIVEIDEVIDLTVDDQSVSE